MFKRIKSDKYGTVSLLDIPMKATVVYKRGMALVIGDAGTAEIASGDVKATYICYEDATGVADGYIRGARISNDETYKTTLSAAGTSLKVGNKVTFATDGLRITATAATNNGAEITKIISSASGGEVEVRL